MRALYSVSIVVPLTMVYSVFTLIAGLRDRLLEPKSMKEGRIGKGGAWIKRTWFRLILKLHRIHVKITGPGVQALKKARGAIIVANHQSVLDIPVIASLAPTDSSFLAKKELRKLPFFGLSAAIVGTQFIDRSKGARDHSIDEVNRLVGKGLNLILFPEGTRSTHGHLLPFKRGAFVMAIQNQAPIIPISILDSWKLCPKKSLGVNPGTIHIYVGEPISTRGFDLEKRGALADQVRDIIAKQLDKFMETRENESL